MRSIRPCALAVAVLALAGCRASRCRLPNDDLGHALYYSRCHQALVYVNETCDAHALADTRFAHQWSRAMDVVGHDGYRWIHRGLNPPCCQDPCTAPY